ncbi:hypothetical protein [Algibacter sp.]|uniref:hypothetical protein n=1 Tax=Algibacter sp. TaxID=1872428 RepID=UPI003C7377E0
METIDFLYTWEGLFFLCLLLVAIYWGLKFLLYFFKFLSKRYVYNKLIINLLTKAIVLYKPFAVVVLVLYFISINYITHTIILAMVSLFGYNYFKNYIQGIFLKLNRLIEIGTVLKIDNNKGDIRKILPFGILLNTENGEQFLNYSTIEKSGFTILSIENKTFQQTLFLQTEESIDTILDLLFDNPILSFIDRPVVSKGQNSHEKKLQYTLELGATSQDLVDFLKGHNIKTSLTNTF